jgi:hypothetical protein
VSLFGLQLVGEPAEKLDHLATGRLAEALAKGVLCVC